jgi:hypothetical protein
MTAKEAIWIFFVAILYSVVGVAASALPENVVMSVGDTREFTFPVSANLRLSTKGVLELFSVGDGSWQITGLKQGFVIVNWSEEGSDKAVDGRLFIEVRRKLGGRLGTPEKGANSQQRWCGKSGLTCSVAGDEVGGVTSDFWHWLMARGHCRAETGCRFAAMLEEPGRAALEGWFRSKVGAAYELTLSEDSSPQILATCSEEVVLGDHEQLLDYLLHGMIEESLLLVRCRRATELKLYRMKIRVLLVEKNAARELGVAPQLGGISPLRLPVSDSKFSARLRSLEHQHRAKTIGEPTLLMTLGQEATVQNGGEFKVTYQTNDKDQPERQGWKRTGLDLSAVLLEHSGNTLSFKYQLTLKNLTGGGSAVLSSNAMGSVVNLKLNESVVVGNSDLSFDLEGFESDFSFGSIPILGPLFRTSRHESANAQLMLWIGLEES